MNEKKEIIRTQNLTKCYGNHKAVNQLSIAVKENDFVLLFRLSC